MSEKAPGTFSSGARTLLLPLKERVLLAAGRREGSVCPVCGGAALVIGRRRWRCVMHHNLPGSWLHGRLACGARGRVITVRNGPKVEDELVVTHRYLQPQKEEA